MRNNFTFGLLLRFGLFLAATALFAASILQPGLGAARLLTGLLLLAAVTALWRHIDRTNREIARFVEAIRHHDFSQTFSRVQGSGFAALGLSLEEAMAALREERVRIGEESGMLSALVEEAPSALLLVDDEQRVTLANKAARKLFRHLSGTRVADFIDYGGDLSRVLAGAGRADRRLIDLRTEDVTQRAIVSRSVVDRGGRRVAAVSVQTISEELSEVELAAQANLVRVLTHEIMNSLTPVVSLAQSAASLICEIDDDPQGMVGDARLAIDTLARRTAGILHFVESYRAFARPPEPRMRLFEAAPWAHELETLFAASPAAGQARLEVMLGHADLRINGDPDLITQLAINIVKNGAEAAAGTAVEPLVRLSLTLAAGGKVRLTIEDNGPGIAAGHADDLFLPFFTTKAGGTGVGLSLARQIVIAHRGTIEADGSPLGGARFTILF